MRAHRAPASPAAARPVLRLFRPLSPLPCSIAAAAPGNRTLGIETLPIEIKGSAIWPTVLGDNGHKVWGAVRRYWRWY